MKVALIFALLLVAAQAADLRSAGSWQNEAFATAFPGFSFAGTAAAKEATAMPDPVVGYKYADLASGAGNMVKQMSTASETFFAALFDAVVNKVKTSVASHTLSWCNSFHAHSYYNSKTDDFVFIFHNREYCALTHTELQACYANAVVSAADYAGIGTLCEIAETMGPTGYCAKAPNRCSGGFDKHLMVYSSKDAKLYFWDTYAHYLTGFESAVGGDDHHMIPTGGMYQQVFATPADWERLADVNIHVEQGAKKVWGRANDFDRSEAVNTAHQDKKKPPAPPSPPALSQIFVRGLGPKTLALDVTGTTKFSEVLSQAIAKAAGKPSTPEIESNFYMIHQGKIAKPTATLADAKVQQHDTVHVNGRLRGGAKKGQKATQSQLNAKREKVEKEFQIFQQKSL